MNTVFTLKTVLAVVETVCLCLAVYYGISGIKTKKYTRAGIFFLCYLVLNLLRNFSII